MNKPISSNPVVIHGGGLVCPRGKSLHAAALRCQEEAPHLLPPAVSTAPKHAFLFESMIDALNDLVGEGLATRFPQCTVLLVTPDQRTFQREVAPFYKSLREAIGLRLGVTSLDFTNTWGSSPAADVLAAVVEPLSRVRQDAPVLILGAQPERRRPDYPEEECTEEAAVAILLGAKPRQSACVEVAAAPTVESQLFEQVLEPTIQYALDAAGITMGDVGHVVLDEREGRLSRAQLQAAAQPRSITGAWAGSIWSPADVFGDTGSMAGFLSFLVAYDITLRGLPDMHGMWVSDDGERPHAFVLRAKRQVSR